MIKYVILNLTMFLRNFIFLYVFFFSVYLCELALFGYDVTRIINMVENITFSCTIYCFFWLFSKRVSLKISHYIFYFLMFFTSVEGVYFLMFNGEFTSSALFIALDTNISEVKEFLKFNFKILHILYCFGVFVSFYLSWKYFQPAIIKRNFQVRGLLIFILSLGMFLMSKPKIFNYNVFFAIINSIVEYSRERQLLTDLQGNNNPFTDLIFTGDSGTHVVVIGESTSRLHFGLYGYQRNTTPRLTELKDEIKLFKDVTSGDTYTVGSLVKALMVKHKGKYVGNVIQMFKQAGFKTYWLSNQPPIGIYETLVTKIGLSADVVKFTNAENYFQPTLFDEILFPEIDQALKAPEQKQIIFIHLMGTHADYAYRYPKSFSLFPTALKDNKQNAVNHYDNAIFYSDFVTRSIIERARKTKASSVLFFSDHGEEVFDSIDFVGHPPNGTFTYNMVEIPFFVWGINQKKVSPEYLDRKFSINDLSHSLADLYGVYAKEIDTTRSVFHKSFVERPRIVWDTILID